MAHVRVTFPHKDSTGRKRKVGEVYEVAEAEAKVRVEQDHFAVRVDAPKPAPKPTPKPDSK